MKEAVRMWKYPTMIFSTLLTALIYAAFLIPSKKIPLIPGITEIRPATVFPVVFGILFGPAGAWGSALGNLVADCYGTMTYASIFGFLGNFVYAYAPYKIWAKYRASQSPNKSLSINSPRNLIEFGIAAISGSASCALVIALGTHLIGMTPFATLSAIIVSNNGLLSVVLGPILLVLIYPYIKKKGLLWSDVMLPEDIYTSANPKLYSSLVILGSFGGILAGLTLSMCLTSQPAFSQSFALGTPQNLYLALGVFPFTAVMLYGLHKL